jgi:3-methyladenine DNA glycosylase AlkD
MCRFGEESWCALMTLDQVRANLKQHANAQAVAGMASFGIRPAQALGVSIPTLRKMAKDALKELQAKEIKD